MTPEKQRIAIATACGYSQCRIGLQAKNDVEPRGWRYKGKEFSRLPDYLGDLNAMNEAEKVLSDRMKYWPDYIDELSKLFRVGFPNKDATNWSQMCHATAANRAEAFLKTLGLWEETK